MAETLRVTKMKSILCGAVSLSRNFFECVVSRKLREKCLIRVHSRDSRVKILLLSVWLFAVCSIGFSESFPNRPTAYDLEEIVILGKESVLGVSERCYATQYQTNPATYHVSPPFVKTNSAGWYLDQSTMGTMASKIKSLVPYYVNPDTVYTGTTNISMLSVTGVWAELGIGDHVNQFTCIPASGTNPPTYGDYPWRMYEQDLVERCEVLSILCKTAFNPGNSNIRTNVNWKGQDYPGPHYTNRYATSAEAKAKAAAEYNACTPYRHTEAGPEGYCWLMKDGSGKYYAGMVRGIGSYYAVCSAQISHSSAFWMYTHKYDFYSTDHSVWDAEGEPYSTSYTMVAENGWNKNGYEEFVFGLTDFPIVNNWPDDDTKTVKGFLTRDSGAKYIIYDWDFQYGTGF